MHRKGATPAGEGVLGVIPGSMADPGIRRSRPGNTRRASTPPRTAPAGGCRARRPRSSSASARSSEALAERGIRVLAAGSDEVPGVYKNIDEVMAAQLDLVERSPASIHKSSRCVATAAGPKTEVSFAQRPRVARGSDDGGAWPPAPHPARSCRVPARSVSADGPAECGETAC